jgi:hypothetical protein
MRLPYTGMLVELEHLKIKTTLTGECDGSVCVYYYEFFLINKARAKAKRRLKVSLTNKVVKSLLFQRGKNFFFVRAQ